MDITGTKTRKNHRKFRANHSVSNYDTLLQELKEKRQIQISIAVFDARNYMAKIAMSGIGG